MGYVYEITNVIDDRVYIGSTINLDKRWCEHKRDLMNNSHQNIHLQRFVNKYSIDSISFHIIEKIDNKNLLTKEQHYLDITKNKFNIATDSSAPMMGKHHTKEAKEKAKTNSYIHTLGVKFDYLKSNDIHPEAFGKFDRQTRRSITPAGFAKAFFEANQ